MADGSALAVRIGPAQLGEGHPCFIIAEAGVNHMGKLEVAEKMIDVAADSGADAIKFQLFAPETLAAPSAEQAEYQKQNTGLEQTQAEMLRSLALANEDFVRLKARAERAGLVFLCTPFDEAGADFLASIGVDAFKVSSGDLTHHPFLASLARKGRPIILSTGMSTLDEIRAALGVIRSAGGGHTVLTHCVSAYPAPDDECHLRSMATMTEELGCLVGWSDHTRGIEIGLAAVALGAHCLEKHFTLSRSLPGPDQPASLEPDELRALVSGVRRIERALGESSKAPRASESEVRQVARRSLHAARDLPVGHLLAAEDVSCLRPGTGISPSRLDDAVGRRLTRSVRRSEILQWSDFDQEPK